MVIVAEPAADFHLRLTKFNASRAWVVGDWDGWTRPGVRMHRDGSGLLAAEIWLPVSCTRAKLAVAGVCCYRFKFVVAQDSRDTHFTPPQIIFEGATQSQNAITQISFTTKSICSIFLIYYFLHTCFEKSIKAQNAITTKPIFYDKIFSSSWASNYYSFQIFNHW